MFADLVSQNQKDEYWDLRLLDGAYDELSDRPKLTPIYEAMNMRTSKGSSRNGGMPLNITSTMHATMPYAPLSHCPCDLYGYRG